MAMHLDGYQPYRLDILTVHLAWLVLQLLCECEQKPHRQEPYYMEQDESLQEASDGDKAGI